MVLTSVVSRGKGGTVEAIKQSGSQICGDVMRASVDSGCDEYGANARRSCYSEMGDCSVNKIVVSDSGAFQCGNINRRMRGGREQENGSGGGERTAVSVVSRAVFCRNDKDMWRT